MPEVSVVIPSYNHAAFIAEAVESVLRQTHRDLELIVVDDGSSDNSLEVLAGFSDSRMVVFSQANQGAHAAINRGLREARGDYLAILNSDDAFHPERLEKILQALKTQPRAGLAGSYIQIVDSQGNSLGVKHGYLDCPPWLLEHPERSSRAGDDLHAALLTENFWSTTSNYVFPRQLYQQVGEFLPLRYAHDWDFALRLAHLAPSILLPEPLVRYRVHASNTIRENQVAMIFEICWILAVHLPRNAALSDVHDREVLAGRIDQLLNSIYVFGMERLLSLMLLQRLDQNPDQALELLEPGNPARLRYLAFIDEQLASEGGAASGAGSSATGALDRSQNGLRRLLARLRALMGQKLE
jgi:glycosyltransferase involved in cell wall biosynthesis